jgi:hypothetical protein
MSSNKASNSEQFFRRFLVAVATLPPKINYKIAAFWRR